MAGRFEKPNTLLWTLRALITGFLLGYLIDIYLSVFVAGIFPTGNTLEDFLGIAFLLVFGLSYYLMWMRRETLAGLIFILWYASLWPAELFVGGDTFRDSPFPGILMFILGLLLIIYRTATRKKSG